MNIENLVHNPPKQVYKKMSGQLTVVGCAEGVWEDLKEFGRADQGDIMAVNEMIMFYEFFTGQPTNHAASMHPDMLPYFVGVAERQGKKPSTDRLEIVTHGNKEPGAKYIWNILGVTHSGVFATMVGVLMGYSPIILCGMPCDGSPYFYGPKDRLGTWYNNPKGSAQMCWKEYLPYLKGIVFSMSGNTEKWLGRP